MNSANSNSGLKKNRIFADSSKSFLDKAVPQSRANNLWQFDEPIVDMPSHRFALPQDFD